jgi:hypothetical protein
MRRHASLSEGFLGTGSSSARTAAPLSIALGPWRQMARAVKGARGASYLGSRASARAAAVELYEAAWDVRVKTKAILASLGAKLEFATDLRTLSRLLEDHDSFVSETRSRPAARRLRPCYCTGHQESLQVEVARNVPIAGIFVRYGLKLRPVGGEFVTRCPFHDDRRPSLRVNPEKCLWHCFPCGAGGDGIAFVMRLRGVDFAAAVRELAA